MRRLGREDLVGLKIFAAIVACGLLPLSALAQSAAPPPAPVMVASPAEVAAAAARVKAKGGTAMVLEPLVSSPSRRAVIEYRSQPTPASTPEAVDEIITVVEGGGTIILGGALRDETRRSETERSGTGIDGGKTYPLEKGTYLLIPAGTAHYFASIGPQGLTIVTLKAPK